MADYEIEKLGQQLVEAAYDGDVAKVKHVLTTAEYRGSGGSYVLAGTTLHRATEGLVFGDTALHAACRVKDGATAVAIAKMVMEASRGRLLHAKNTLRRTPLAQACVAHNVAILRYLLSLPGGSDDLTVTTSIGHDDYGAPLAEACSSGDPDAAGECVEVLLASAEEAGLDMAAFVGASNKVGKRAIHAAAETGNARCVRALLRASPDEGKDFGRHRTRGTAFSMAVAMDDAPTVREFLRACPAHCERELLTTARRGDDAYPLNLLSAARISATATRKVYGGGEGGGADSGGEGGAAAGAGAASASAAGDDSGSKYAARIKAAEQVLAMIEQHARGKWRFELLVNVWASPSLEDECTAAWREYCAANAAAVAAGAGASAGDAPAADAWDGWEDDEADPLGMDAVDEPKDHAEALQQLYVFRSLPKNVLHGVYRLLVPRDKDPVDRLFVE